MSTAPNTLAESAASPAGGDWHRRNVDAVLAEFGSSMDGLADAAIADRRAEFGPNELQESGGTSKLRLIWGQISSVMVLILIGAAVLSFLLGKYLEAGAIAAIVVLFTALGFYQEYRAEQAIAALRRMAVPSARVTRDGRLTSVSVSELVPGDIVHLDAGTDRARRPPPGRGGQPAHRGGGAHRRVRADRQADRGGRSGRPRPRATGCAWRTRARRSRPGAASGVVVATGMRTELGHIAALLQGVESEPTPLPGPSRPRRQAARGARCPGGARRGRDGSDRRRVGDRSRPHRHQRGRGGHPRGAPRGRDVHAGDRRAADAAAPGADPQAPGRRDARLGHRDLLGQDRARSRRTG